MKMMKYNYILGVAVLIGIVVACKKPYNPTIISGPNHYLVVEGVVDNSGDTTTIRLSQTVNVSEGVSNSGVNGYTVTIDDETGNTVATLAQPANNPNGQYKSNGGLNLSLLKKYRLHILGNGKEYTSDYISVKPTPPIDSLGFIPKGNNLNVYVNTHDATNGTRYYRWDYKETWKFHSKYPSDVIVDKTINAIRNRTAEEGIYYCFTGDASSNIILGSSAKLASDVIFQAPITVIPSTAEKISVRYSILLKQYALTKEAYEFWENIRKNTEQLGSIFDAQPSQLQGNIHCLSDPKEAVIGFITITNVQQKRIYINNSQLPSEWFPIYPYNCTADSAFIFNPKTMQNEVKSLIIDGGSIPISAIVKMNNLVGYLYSTIECTDCTIRGKTQQPSFWVP